MGADRNAPQNAHKETNSKSKIKGTDKSIMNRLGVYDVDAAFDKMSLQTTDEFGLDAILEQLVRAADVEGVRRLRTSARRAHDDTSPVLAPRRPFVRQDPRLLLVRRHR